MSSLERADPVILEKQIKAKWMNEYISEINNKSSRRQLEVRKIISTFIESTKFKKNFKNQKEKELQLEKEHNECLIKEALQQRERNLKYKMDVSNKLSQEYKKEEEEKRLRKMREDEEYKMKQNTSLDHKYDQHVHFFRTKVSSLSDRVDSNAQSYLKYKNASQKDDYYKKIEEYQDKCFNSIKQSQEANEKNYNNINNYGTNLKSSLDQYIKELQQKNNGVDAKNEEISSYENNVNNNNTDFNPDLYKVDNPYLQNSNQYQDGNPFLDQEKNYLLDSNYYNNSKLENYQSNTNNKYTDNKNLNFNSSIKNPNEYEFNQNTDTKVSSGNNNFNYYSLDKIRQHSPSYKQFYSFNPEKEYNLKDTTTTLRNNIIAHNNAHHLDEIFKKSKSNYTAISRSILDFNKEQVKYKDMAKALEDENKRKLVEERLKESQKIKLENIESNLVRHQKQVNYKSILDHQMIPNYGVNTDQDQFKFYVTPKNYFLGGTQLDHNPIINPVNNYNFARYYLQRNNMNQSMKQVLNK